MRVGSAVLGGKRAHLRPTLEPGDEISSIFGVAFGSLFCHLLVLGQSFSVFLSDCFPALFFSSCFVDFGRALGLENMDFV